MRSIVHLPEVKFHITTQPHNNMRKCQKGRGEYNHILIVQVSKKCLEIRDEPIIQ